MTLANASKQLMCLLLVLPGMPCLAEQSEKETETPSAIKVELAGDSKLIEKDKKKPRKSRLKYRNGPVCMCSGGLSEADIQAAWLKRFSQTKTLEQ